MGYMGGKHRIAKDIVKILRTHRKLGQLYIEPFVGGGSVISLMDREREASDFHYELIEMYKAIQNGWIPPYTITKDMYQKIRGSDDDPALKGFVGFFHSWGGKYFGGYIGEKSDGRVRMGEGYRYILKKTDTMKNVHFKHCNYKDLNPNNALIYCDPPYDGCTGYGLGKFDSTEFWEWCRVVSKNNTVIISEYTAPDDFKCIWEKDVKLCMRSKNGCQPRTEKLFMIN